MVISRQQGFMPQRRLFLGKNLSPDEFDALDDYD
jgi:hypothetical protein